MSRYGDNRQHMNDWSEALEERAEQVGARQAVKEFTEVLRDFADYYWSEPTQGVQS